MSPSHPSSPPASRIPVRFTGPRKPVVLIVAEDTLGCDQLGAALANEGYHIMPVWANLAHPGVYASVSPNIVVFDLGPATAAALEVCLRQYQGSDARVIVLTDRQWLLMRLVDLGLSASTYLFKPVAPFELLNKVRTELHESVPTVPLVPEQLKFEGISIYPTHKLVEVGGQLIPLTTKELKLLMTLARVPRYVFSREELLKFVWDNEYVTSEDTRTVDMHISILRKKLEVGPNSRRFIETIYGSGYCFNPEGAAPTVDQDT